MKSIQFYLSWSDLGRDNLFKVIRVGRETVRGVGGQVGLGRGEVEQDLAWDRPAALGYCRPQLQSALSAVVGSAELGQGQGGHQDRVQH